MDNKFLFISSYDLRRNTSSNIRTIALMHSLSNLGYEIDVAYIQSNNPIDTILNEALNRCCLNQFKLIGVDDNQSLTVIKKNKLYKDSLKEKIKSKALRIYSKLFVYDVFQTKFKSIDKKALYMIKDDYDYVVSSSEPRSSHKLAKIIIEKCKLKGEWIQYWGDPMSNDIASNKLFPSLEKKEEKKLLKQCAYAIYTNPGCARYMQEKYSFAAKKISWIPTTDTLMNNNMDVKNTFDFSYVGDYLSKHRNIVPFYHSCVELGINGVIAGSGDVELTSTNNIKVLGRVSRKEAIDIENHSKILVVIDNNKAKKDVCIQVPGKLYHFALTYKYVLVITDSDILMKDYQHYSRFIFCRNNTEDISKAIKNILSSEMRVSFKSPLDDFSQNAVAIKLLKTLNKH